MNELRIIADALANKTNKFALVYYAYGNNCCFSAISKNHSLINLAKVLRENYNARCGGKDGIIQGNVILSDEKFTELVSKISL